MISFPINSYTTRQTRPDLRRADSPRRHLPASRLPQRPRPSQERSLRAGCDFDLFESCPNNVRSMSLELCERGKRTKTSL